MRLIKTIVTFESFGEYCFGPIRTSCSNELKSVDSYLEKYKKDIDEMIKIGTLDDDEFKKVQEILRF